MEDKTLTCHECASAFCFSSDEQAFFAAKGLTNEPKRCPNCRLIARIRRNGGDVDRLKTTICARCDAPVVVSFQPKGYKPIYCSHCLKTRPEADQPITVAV